MPQKAPNCKISYIFRSACFNRLSLKLSNKTRSTGIFLKSNLECLVQSSEPWKPWEFWKQIISADTKHIDSNPNMTNFAQNMSPLKLLSWSLPPYCTTVQWLTSSALVTQRLKGFNELITTHCTIASPNDILSKYWFLSAHLWSSIQAWGVCGGCKG